MPKKIERTDKYDEDMSNHQSLKDVRDIFRKTHYGDEMLCTLIKDWGLIPWYDT